MDSSNFNVFQSNRLEVLATVLAEQLRIPANENPFTPDVILVQSPGMSEWLKISIAQRLGIAANLSFPLPSSFIWQLYQVLIDDVPETSVFNKDRLRWHINRELDKHLNDPEFSNIKAYLSQSEIDKEISQDYAKLKQFKLSEKIADAYDNYLMYRPEWLEHWESGADDLPGFDNIGHQQWQAIMWRAVKASISELGINTHNRHTLHQSLMNTLSTGLSEDILQKLPKRLFVFGISSLPKHQMDVLEALSSHISVDVFWLNPCQVYWGDIVSDKTKARMSNHRVSTLEKGESNYFVSGNPLLASWGKVGRDYLDSLTERSINFNDLFYPKPTDTLLQQIQHDIYELQFRQSQSPLTIHELNRHHGKQVLPNDNSIKVHSCHNRLRELEVLKDSLLHTFNSTPELLPKDVLVMVPDINDYAPFIDAVFSNNAESPETYLPYAISDRSGLQENPVLNTFVSLIGLPTARFKVSEVLDWLEVPEIMVAFELDTNELNELKQWINQTQIKWSVDGTQKAKWNLPTDNLNTWLFGLKRMMLGVSAGNASSWNGIPSFDDIEGIKANTLAKLIEYISYLVNLKNAFEQPQNVADWHTMLSRLVIDLFEGRALSKTRTLMYSSMVEAAPGALDTLDKSSEGPGTHLNDVLESTDPFVLQQLRNSIDKLNEYQEQHDAFEPISAIVVQQVIGQELNQTGVSQRFLAGRINFCTLMPMRSVPFKVIAILGLNDGEFPRHVEPLSFDLVNQNPARKGDRSRKLDERYLFLEAVCSAELKLHLSYIGQSDKNNSSVAPSLLLSELLDYIGDSYVIDKKWLNDSGCDIVDNVGGDKQTQFVKDRVMIKHNLQPFNQSYFVDNALSSSVQSFNKQWFTVANVLTNSLQKEQSDVVSQGNNLDSLKTTDFDTEQGIETQVELNQLISFAKNPIKYFYRQLLGINLQLDEEELDDLEPFEHTGLTKYQLIEQLVSTPTQTERDNVRWQSLHSGEFPKGQWGEALFEQYQLDADLLLAKRQQITGIAATNSDNAKLYSKGEHVYKISTHLPIPVGKDSPQQIDLELLGQIKLVDGVLFVNRLHDKIRYEDEVEGWLLHLVRCIANKPGPTVICSLKPNNYVLFEPVSAQQAQDYLCDWISHWWRLTNQQTYFNWLGSLAKEYIQSLLKGTDENKSRFKTMTEFHKITEPVAGMVVDPYKEKFVSHAFGALHGQDVLPDEFYDTSRSLLIPLYENITSLNDKKLELAIERLFEEATNMIKASTKAGDVE